MFTTTSIPSTDTELLLVTGPLVVIALTLAINIFTQRIRAFSAIIIGTLLTALAWIILIIRPTVTGVVLTLIAVALGEITQSPRYYEYISRLAPSGQQGTYMGFAFLPLGIGSLIGGKFGGFLIHHYGEVKHQPGMMWWVIMGVGVLTAILLWVYDRFLMPKPAGEAWSGPVDRHDSAAIRHELPVTGNASGDARSGGAALQRCA